MSGTEDLIALLAGRLDEDEQTARAAARHAANWDPARVLAEVEADRQLVAAYQAAVRRKKASWRNYAAWLNGDPEPYSVLPDGPDEKAIPGLEIAIRIRAVRFDRDADCREEWRP